MIIGYLASVCIGLSLGLIGSGGSILTVPILIYFFGFDPVLATTYSLFVVGITSMAGALSHYVKGNVDHKIALLFGIPSLVAIFTMRKWVMPVIPQHLFYINSFEITKAVLLMIVFAGLMLAASISMIRTKEETAEVKDQLNIQRLIIQSIIVGVITGFVGVGGGFLIIPSLIHFARLPMKKAVGTSLTIMSISALLGVFGDISRNIHIDYVFMAKFSAFAIAGIITGSYLTKFFSENKLKPAFGWCLLLMGISILFSTLISK